MLELPIYARSDFLGSHRLTRQSGKIDWPGQHPLCIRHFEGLTANKADTSADEWHNKNIDGIAKCCNLSVEARFTRKPALGDQTKVNS